jgi:mono/diheme cytochrome c family protein
MTNGRNERPASGAVLSQDQLRDVAAYVLQDYCASDLYEK